MTVPSIPMLSASARSISHSSATLPRKKLPPPTTTASSIPSSRAAISWSATYPSAWLSRPKSASPANARPLSLTTTRR